MIRAYRASDALQLAQLFHLSVETIAPHYYTLEQVRAWSARGANAAETHARCMDGRQVWIATDEADHAVAFIDLVSTGYIDFLFCHPDHIRRGNASALYKSLEAAALTQGMQNLTTDASACAKAVFASWGFVEIRRNDFERNGVHIFNFAMSKNLSP